MHRTFGRRTPGSAGIIAAGLSLSLLGPIGSIPPGCSRSPAQKQAQNPPEQVYTVRGRIAGLPEAGKPFSALSIHHEEIPNFVRQDGKLGMESMEMEFPPAKGVSLAGLSVGDPIEFTFEMRWKSQPHIQLTKIRKLSAETKLVLAGENSKGG